MDYEQLLAEYHATLRRRNALPAVPEGDDWWAAQAVLNSEVELKEEIYARKIFVKDVWCAMLPRTSLDAGSRWTAASRLTPEGLKTYGTERRLFAEGAEKLNGLPSFDSAEQVDATISQMSDREAVLIFAAITKTWKKLAKGGYCRPQTVDDVRSLLKFHFSLVTATMRVMDMQLAVNHYGSEVLRGGLRGKEATPPETTDSTREALTTYCDGLVKGYPHLFPAGAHVRS